MSNSNLTPNSNRETLLEIYQNCQYLAKALNCEARVAYSFEQFKVKSPTELTDDELLMLINVSVGACLGWVV